MKMVFTDRWWQVRAGPELRVIGGQVEIYELHVALGLTRCG